MNKTQIVISISIATGLLTSFIIACFFDYTNMICTFFINDYELLIKPIYIITFLILTTALILYLHKKKKRILSTLKHKEKQLLQKLENKDNAVKTYQKGNMKILNVIQKAKKRNELSIHLVEIIEELKETTSDLKQKKPTN